MFDVPLERFSHRNQYIGNLLRPLALSTCACSLHQLHKNEYQGYKSKTASCNTQRWLLLQIKHDGVRRGISLGECGVFAELLSSLGSPVVQLTLTPQVACKVRICLNFYAHLEAVTGLAGVSLWSEGGENE